MILYETTFIVNPQSDDAVIEEKVKAISELISGNGGKIVREDRMGTRRLAYPINKLHQGYYATFLHESDKSVLPILERHMKLDEVYMRHLTIRFEADPERVYAEKKEDYRLPRSLAKPNLAKDSTGPVTEAPKPKAADSGSETAEIKVADSTEESDSGNETAEIKVADSTEKSDSGNETAEIEIVATTEEAAAEKPKPADSQPEDEEL